MFINTANIPDKTEAEAWKMLEGASNERDIGDFKEYLKVLAKAVPELTYSGLEKELRKRNMNIFLIAMVGWSLIS